MKDEFQKKLEYIIAVIEEAGYNPLNSYMLTFTQAMSIISHVKAMHVLL